MSIRNIQGSAILPREINRSLQALDNGWTRNPSWLPLPAITSADEKVVGIVAVFPDSNFASVLFATSGGAQYQVDWGDGSIELVNSSVQRDHQYLYSAAALANTNAPVTLTSTNPGNVNRTAHGYTNGMTVRFFEISTAGGFSGISEGQIYYVVNASADSFQISNTLGGTALAFGGTTGGTANLLQYKQAQVTITPVSGTFSTVSLATKNATTGLQNYSSGWLDLALSVSAATTAISPIGAHTHGLLERVQVLRCPSTSTTGWFWNCYSLKSVELNLTNAVTGCSSMFNGCASLQVAPYFEAASPDMSNMFASCRSLVSVPQYNTQTTTTMSGMFSNCSSLVSVPAFNTQNVSIMTNMFNGCTSLESIPLFNTQSVTSPNSMFLNCSSLKTIPKLNMAAAINAAGMFSGCYNLVSLPDLNFTSSLTNTSNMFNNCNSLQAVPLFTTSSVTTANGMFTNCQTLTSVPFYDFSQVTSGASMFNACTSLQTIPPYDLRSMTTMTSMFQGCSSLATAPRFNLGTSGVLTNTSSMFQTCPNLVNFPGFAGTAGTLSVTNMASMFSGCASLQSIGYFSTQGPTASTGFSNMFATCPNLANIDASGFRFTFSITGCKLSATELNAIYTALPTVTGQTITVTNNWGTATDNPAIATAKGWTVTG